MGRFSATVAAHDPASDPVGPTIPGAGHAILTIAAEGTVTSCNDSARLLFAVDPDDGPTLAGDLFGPPVGGPDGVRALLAHFAATPGRPPAWTGDLTCLRNPSRPFVVTATAARDRHGPDGRDGLTVICGPPPPPGVTLPAAAWLPPELSRRVGHELRGSLSGIAGLAAVMVRRLGTAGGTADERRRLRMIEQSARTGLTLVDQVAELSRLESGQTRCRPAPTGVREIITAAIGACARTTPDDVRIRDVTTEDGIVADTDPVLARHLLAGLIAHAAATAAHHVRIRAVPETDTVLIEVTDDGRDITPDERTTIADPVVRDQTPADGTTGLGLHLATRRAHLLGATVTVRSSAGSGSTCRLSLPAHRESPASSPPGPAGAGT